jgi:diacylglycerol kinase (ATP)
VKKRKLLFIINPISGIGKQKEGALLIKENINKDIFDFDIVYTKAPRHATELSAQASCSGYDVVVAVGGDGSVNEVATGLLGTESALGILPYGSGNGLARHFSISTTIKKAISILNTGKVIHMDTIQVNGTPFMGISGVGFDAHIANLFAQYGKRGFSSYLKLIWKEFLNYEAKNYSLIIDGRSLERKAFMISIANGSQFGNNAFIAPSANASDGLMDVCIIKKGTVPTFAMLVFRLFNKSADRSSLMETIRCKSLVILKNTSGLIHLDGEPNAMEETLNFKVVPSSLKILVPENFNS